jgi:RNA polymerase sigma factor (sigma-70 family)
MDPHKLLEVERESIRRVVAFVCRKHGLRGADAEDFESTVTVKLLENDCAILRQFRGDSNLKTYLNVVVQRIFIDQCVHEHGKWRASADAKRTGPIATELERLVQWEGESVDEAVRQTATAHPDVPVEEIEAIAEHIPQRQRRRSTVALDECLEQILTARERADVLMLSHERTRISARAAQILRQQLQRLEPQDRLVLQLQFEAGMQISEIAKKLRVEQKPLYRRRDALLADLREALTQAGIDKDDAHELLGYLTDEEDFGLRNSSRSPSTEAGRAAVATRTKK